ncbi:MAG: hypothetical protein ACMVP2_04600 [Imperialibacter sp.]|uniref:hypothetical protein n=1 Tax=Imperialibacter sp. TaxID=2038411 RepID=UPI003A84A286
MPFFMAWKERHDDPAEVGARGNNTALFMASLQTPQEKQTMMQAVLSDTPSYRSTSAAQAGISNPCRYRLLVNVDSTPQRCLLSAGMTTLLMSVPEETTLAFHVLAANPAGETTTDASTATGYTVIPFHVGCSSRYL